MAVAVSIGAPCDARRLHADFAHACAASRRWPLPGQGRTARRLTLLAGLARRDLVLGRLVEAHADARAISAELGYRGSGDDRRWGVWAAGPPDGVTARRVGGRWVLEGVKRWCSGAPLVTHALVDAAAPDGQQLFAVRVACELGVHVQPESWRGPGMACADTRSVAFDQVEADPVGLPGEYLSRPGFWMGAIGVAACWHGGSRAVAEPLYRRSAKPAVRVKGDPILMAHLGAVHAALSSNRALLRTAAATLDRQPGRDHSVLALVVRDAIERNATAIIDHVGRALGPGPLALDADHAQLVCDLSVYVRQHHGDADRAEIGRLVSERSR